MKNKNLKGNLILLLTAFVWGVSFIAQSKGVEKLSPNAFNGIRSILGGIVLLPVIFVIDGIKKKNGTPVRKIDKNLITGGIACGFFLCCASTLQSCGMVYTGPGNAAFITALYMIIIPIIGLFMGKKPRPVILIAVLVATLGMYLMCIKSDFTIGKGDIMLFICAFFFSGHILVIDRFSPHVDGVKLSCLQFFVCGVLNLILMLITKTTPDMQTVHNSWAAIGYAGVMSCGVAYTLQIIGQKYTEPTSASIIMSLESVFSTLTTVILVACGWQLTGGQMTFREILGCIFMFIAILLVQLPEKNSKSTSKTLTNA